ncbi:MAG TPA: NTP transferase domain-containing protein, partial [Kiloniellales bacterium]|nr:NTP transferase domain-containing protein [Kiloniellales bacterium]
MRPIVLIPARLGSTRLSNKPLADINGKPMIVRVLERALAAELGPVVVAAAERAIADAVIAVGGRAVLTDPDLPSGSDRIWAALNQVDPDARHDVVVNVQGDLPIIPPGDIHAALRPLAEPAVHIGTLAAAIRRIEERRSPNVTKVAAALSPERPVARALYFSRAPIPWAGPEDEWPLFHHIGLYAFRREALARFVELP